MKEQMKQQSKVLLAGTIAVLTGGAATQTALEHRTLEFSTKQSESLFLEPISKAQKTIYYRSKIHRMNRLI